LSKSQIDEFTKLHPEFSAYRDESGFLWRLVPKEMRGDLSLKLRKYMPKVPENIGYTFKKKFLKFLKDN
jgi:hypothetical protein